MSEELANLDAVAQADLVRGGEVSPVELVEAAITRIEKLDDQLNAVIHRRFERARDDVASATLPAGPFRGVPMVLKDLDGYSMGDPCHEGNKLLKEIDWHGDHDSALVAKLRASGFVFVGKTNAPEFGLMPTTEPQAYGPTHNPWSLERSPAGSSGGSAAAVASGMVPVGHAGDGGGSIRMPSSACGLFGLKPSRGRVSFGPGEGESWAGLVVRHAITRSVRDSATVLDVVAGPMPGDPYTAPRPERPFADEVGADPGKLRIGLRIDAPGSLCATHPDCVAAAEDTAAVLESLGHSVETTSPAALDETDLMGMFLTIMTPWVVHDVATVRRRAGREVTADDVEPLTWAYTEIGRSYTADQYLEAVEGAHAWSRRVASWWAGGFDLLLTPTMATPPTVLGDLVPPADNPLEGAVKATPVAAYCAPFNVTGQPAMSVPLSWNDEGLPIGTQLVAAYGREDVLLRVASQLEVARPWSDRRPPIHA